MSVPPRDILNPYSEASGSTLELVGTHAAHGVFLVDRNLPLPEWTNTSAESVEGSEVVNSTPQNGVITAQLRVTEPDLDAATNLFTNPSFEKDTGGWSTSGGALTAGGTLARKKYGRAGEYTAELTASAANRGLGANATLAAGTGYMLVFSARKISGAVTKLNVARAAVALGTVDLTDEWQDFAIPVPATTAGAHFFNWRTDAAGVFQIDAVKVAVGVDYTYFDGDTPGCSWSGTIHGSTSTRPASGGPRFWAIVEDLQQAVQRIKRRVGTYLHVPPNGVPVIYDLVDARITGLPQDRSIAHFRCEPTIEFECRPYGRLAPITAATVTGDDFTTISLPNIPGSVDALAALKIKEKGYADRMFAWWGLRHLYLDSNPLEYTSTDFTLLGASSVGGGVISASLFAREMALFSMSGAHKGVYRVWALAGGTNSGEITLTWGVDDARRMIRNPTVVMGTDNRSPIDLGLIIVPPGSNGWSAKLLGKKASSTVTLSRIWLQPVAECAGTIEGSQETIPADMIRMDAFGTAGELNGSSMTFSKVGARTWSVTAGRFTRSGTNLQALSAAAGEILAACSVTGGTPESFGQVRVSAGVTCDLNGAGAVMGVYARRASSNHVKATVFQFGTALVLQVVFTKTGMSNLVAVPGAATLLTQPGRLRVGTSVFNTGLATAYLYDNSSGSYIGVCGILASDLAAGGSNATGQAGITDTRYATGTQTRLYHEFMVEDLSAVETETVLDKSEGALLTHDAYERQDGLGVRVGDGLIEGDYLRVPPSGREGSPSDLSVFVSRSLPGSGIPHSFTDQVDLEVTVTPRVLLTS